MSTDTVEGKEKASQGATKSLPGSTRISTGSEVASTPAKHKTEGETSSPKAEESPQTATTTTSLSAAEEQSEVKPTADSRGDEAAAADEAAALVDDTPPRQVIAVSASKGPAAFFNLARKFLATDDMCDLSALEGAIVSAVDAAHLLERSQLATIVRVNTSYVTVEPKRRRVSQPSDLEEEPSQQLGTTDSAPDSARATPDSSSSQDLKPKSSESTPQHQSEETATPPSTAPSSQSAPRTFRSTAGRELRRARIVITVKRTESYKRWLDENPLQALDESELEQNPGKTT